MHKIPLPALIGDFFGKDVADIFVGPAIRFNHEIDTKIRDAGSVFEIEIAVPGIKKEQIAIEVANRVLMISWIDRDNPGSTEKRYADLSSKADIDKIKARLDHGILFISVGKKAENKPKKIEID